MPTLEAPATKGSLTRPACSSSNTQVPAITPLAPDELARAQDKLEVFETLYRQQLPGMPPPFTPPPAIWAATIFYRSCQFLVHRQFGAEQLVEVFAQQCPDRSNSCKTR